MAMLSPISQDRKGVVATAFAGGAIGAEGGTVITAPAGTGTGPGVLEPSLQEQPQLILQCATSYDALHAEFGESLTAYTWHIHWSRKDAPGLLHALI